MCTLIVTILSLALTSDLPTLTPAMLASLGGALAAALDLPKTAVEALNDRRLRRLLTTELTARFRILAALTPLRLQAMDLVAIAKASGLPIVIRSVSTTPQATPPADDKSIVITLSIVGGVIGLMAFAARVVYSMRSPDRVQDSFTDIVHIRAE